MTSNRVKASLVIVISIGFVSATSFLFNLGMAIWGFVVQSNISSEQNDEKCSVSIVSNLMLAYSILLIIAACGAICHFLASVTDHLLFANSDTAPNKSKPCYSLSQCCFSIFGLGGLAVLIAMTVYLYKDSCKDVRQSMYEQSSPYVITQYVAFFVFNLCTALVMSCIQCCGMFGIASNTSNFERV